MEDEIDLRDYLDVLIKRWKWIVGVTVLAVLVAGVVSFTMPPTYEATATVFVLFQARTNAPSGPQSLTSPQTQLALLQSNEVAQSVVESLGSKLSADEKRAWLRKEAIRVLADTNDKSLFKITAQADAAQKSADVANAWADAGCQVINQEEYRALNQSLPLLKQSVEAASKDLQTAEENLKRMQRDLQIDLLNQQLARTQGILNSQFAERENVKSALAQAQTLRQQVQQGQISLSPEMLLNLQTVATTSGNPLLIQPSQFVNLTQQQQLDQLSAVIAALNGKQQALSTSIDSVSAQVTTLQQQLSDKQAALIEPTRGRDTARANYETAAAQLREAQTRLAAQQNPARVIARAVAPDAPTSPKKSQNIAIAGFLGLLVSVFGVFVFEYFAKPQAPRSI
jgi:uncharacterized protein involved in exopolysaccharide biosynthesis